MWLHNHSSFERSLIRQLPSLSFQTGDAIYTFFTIFLHAIFIDKFFRLVPKWFKLSFTKCELIIIGQGVSIVILQCARCFITIFTTENSACCSKHLPTKIVQVCWNFAFSSFLQMIRNRLTKNPLSLSPFLK